MNLFSVPARLLGLVNLFGVPARLLGLVNLYDVPARLLVDLLGDANRHRIGTSAVTLDEENKIVFCKLILCKYLSSCTMFGIE